jgi:hypothetical protein
MKNKANILLLALPVLITSCITGSYHHTTGNPIGTKEGYVKSKNLMSSDAGLAAAAKKGGITKIGSVDIYTYSNGKIAVRVTGE